MSNGRRHDRADELGYIFAAADRVIGNATLTVNFRPKPTEEHYDPERMHVPGVTLTGDVRRLTVQHPWHDRSDWHIAPGAIDIIDRKQKVVEAFSFGGTLHVENGAQSTTCTLQSPAPLFEVNTAIHTGAVDAVSIFVEEVEMLFARARAGWHGNDAGFMRTLATLDPELLYASCRQAVRAHLKAQPEHLRLTRYRGTLHLLRLMEVEDPVPSYVTPLAEMLRPEKAAV